MFKIVPSKEELQQVSEKNESSNESSLYDNGELEFCASECESEPFPREIPCKTHISVGENLPYGERLMHNTCDTLIRLKDLGMEHRILVLGVIGSFTPYCWNRHLYQVLNKSRYYAERGIDFICCIATNDAYTHTAWAYHLGCEKTVFMLADTSGRFTKAIGMEIVVPWLDSKVRSRRYVIYAEDMVVTKMIVAPDDGPSVKWHCEHLSGQESLEESDVEESDVDNWI